MPKVKKKKVGGGRRDTRPRIEAWSFSRYQVWDKCPRQARYKFIEKLEEPQGEALARGQEIHTAGEIYLNEGGDVPIAYKHFDDLMVELRRLGAVPEGQWAFDATWRSVSWFGPQAWCRIKTDAHYTEGDHCTVIDFKTGKEYPYHEQQLELYVIGAFAKYPSAEKATAELWYLDLADQHSLEYKRKEYPKLVTAWEKRVEPMLKDRTFKPKPGSACRWCHFSAKKGGPCNEGA